MILCIAEKPSVAKDLADVLGARSRKDGYFEGNGYWVSFTFGHLCTLKNPEDYTDNWKRWNLNQLPMIPNRFGIKVINDTGIKKQFSILESLIAKAEEIINCGDAGIEGELIQRWVLTKAKCAKPVKRLWISSLTEEAIKEGFQKLKEASDFDLLYAAGNARAIGNWLLGMNASRLLTLNYANKKGVLSVGRVQTPTLALIVNRYKEIQNFVPQTYWELKTVYRDTLFSSVKGKFTEKEEGLNLLERIKTDDFEITSFVKKKGKEAPPRLFDLTSLQVECNKKLNLSADESLKLIQKLYERKFITYPRVDTTFLPEDVYPKIPKILSGLKPYKEYTSLLEGKKIPKSKKVFDNKKVTDHHAIIPTGTDSSSLILIEKEVFDLIARRFIAAFYPDCIISNTTVMGIVAEIEFKATGKEILENGWRELYIQQANKPDDEDGEKEKDQLMPSFEKGERGPHEPELQEKQTQPPKPYTEATLLRAMETAGKQVDDDELRDLMKENGIGRPSTRANIIETLFKRNYIKRIRKSLEPTETGIQLIDTIQDDLLKSVELTGIWEKKLRQIEKNEYDAKTFIDEMKEMVLKLTSVVKSEKANHIHFEDDKQIIDSNENKNTSDSKTEALLCPKCGKGTILKGKAAFGCSEYKNGCTFKIEFIQFGKKLSEKQIENLIRKKESPELAGFELDGIKQKGKLRLTTKAQLEFVSSEKEKKEEITRCPSCKKGKMLKGNRAWGCSDYKNGCRFILPFNVLEGHYNTKKLTQEIANDYFLGNISK